MQRRLSLAVVLGIAAALLVAGPPGAAAAGPLQGSVGIAGFCTGLGDAEGPPASIDLVLFTAVESGTGDFVGINSLWTGLGTIHLDWLSGGDTSVYTMASTTTLDLGTLTVGADTHELYANFDAPASAARIWTDGPPLKTVQVTMPAVTGTFQWGTDTVSFIMGSLGAQRSGDSQTFSGTLEAVSSVPELSTGLLFPCLLLPAALLLRRRMAR